MLLLAFDCGVGIQSGPMKCRANMTRVGLVALLVVAQMCVFASPVSAEVEEPNLVFREIKITGDEFVVLQNVGSAPIDHLNGYWLGYTGNDAATATAAPSQQLPDRVLAPGKVILLSGGGTIDVCDASLVTNLSPSLSDTKGTLALWQQNSGSFTQLSDARSLARWNKSTTSFTVPAGEIDLKLETSPAVIANPVWYFDTLLNKWAVANFANCSLSVVQSSSVVTTVANWPQDDTEPPATIISLADDGSVGPASLPIADVGLLPPKITELLPNPNGTGNDATDEFIELYNPNDSVFDLTGFVLQTGTTTKHSFKFPSGTMIPTKGFAAFYSADSGLSLSNTSGQADLLDPFGAQISQTDAYGSAKEGQAWALANGTWYWTSQPTPGGANVINQTAVLGSSATKAAVSSKLKAGGAKGATTAGGGGTNTFGKNSAVTTPIHPVALAAVAVLAVGYGVYEYRHDVANKIHEYRKHRAARRRNRQ